MRTATVRSHFSSERSGHTKPKTLVHFVDPLMLTCFERRRHREQQRSHENTGAVEAVKMQLKETVRKHR
jgi:hypothetical protein